MARYTVGGPIYFSALDDYVDGGVLANNPSAGGLTKIQDFYRSRHQRLPISVVVSVGSGKLPDHELGSVDAHEFLYFGKHWFDFKEHLQGRAKNLSTLLGNAVRLCILAIDKYKNAGAEFILVIVAVKSNAPLNI